MITLNPIESRILGVLIEKAQTTPQQYPLTLNALVNGCNQKNNREPVTNYTDEQVLEGLDGLRTKGLVREVMLSGSRVEKYRHVTRDVLEIGTSELVILAELLLRGPQTAGELRGRASRMHPLESIEVVKNVLESLANRQEPLVRQLPPAPGDRAPRYMQLLCPNLHPIDAPSAAGAMPEAYATSAATSSSNDADLRHRVDQLEQELAQLRRIVENMAQSLGVQDMTTGVE